MNDRYVLWIDDDKFFLKRSVEKLEREGINCRFISEIDKALETISNDGENLAGIIMDIMMDPGESLAFHKHNDGFSAGFALYDLIDEMFEEPFPAFFLTNKDIVDATYKGVSIYSKFDYKSKKLVELVKARFGV